MGVNSSVQAVREAVATCTHPSLLGRRRPQTARAVRGEAGGGGGSGSRRGFRAAQPVPGKPRDSEAVDKIVQRRPGRSPSAQNMI